MTTTSIALDFAIEPVDAGRVQFWASFAAQALSQSAFNVVGAAFDAFWWEDNAYGSFRTMQSSLQIGWDYPLACADTLVVELQGEVSRWQYIVERMTQESPAFAGAEEWRADAQRRLEYACGKLSRVVDWVMAYCMLTQQPLPARTQEYLAAQQGSVR